ncbi:MAG: hypothetical protein SGCHY_001793 [Lobulomycetales sp.]
MAITDFATSASGAVLAGNDMEKMTCGLKLSRKQRFIGFGCCFFGGILLSFLSTLLLTTGMLTAFAVLYTVGNLVSLAGTGFLVGFSTQLKKMFDPVRLIATLIFIGSMIATLIVAFTLDNGQILVLILCLVQFIALFWYSASYIPFGRDMIKRACGAMVS